MELYQPEQNEFSSMESDTDVAARILALKLFVYYPALVSGCICVAAFDVVAQMPFQVLLGLAIAHGVELQHQVLHSLGIKNRRAQRALGFLLGLPMLVSFSAYQDAHLRHHRLVGTKDDKEFFEYDTASGVTFKGLLILLFMPRHYRTALARMYRAFANWENIFSSRVISRRVRQEYAVMALILGTCSILSITTGSTLIIETWFMPLVLIATPVHVLVELPEHFGCERESQDVFRNTRSITSGPFMRWFTNGNNFHVEHHYMPSCPIERLSHLHKQFSGRIMFSNPTYRSFYSDLLAALRKSQPARQTNRMKV